MRCLCNAMLEAERVKDLSRLLDHLKANRANMFLPCAFTKDGCKSPNHLIVGTVANGHT